MPFHFPRLLCSIHTQRNTHTHTGAHEETLTHTLGFLKSRRLTSVNNFIPASCHEWCIIHVCVCVYLWVSVFVFKPKLNCYLRLVAVYTCLLPSATRIARLWFINNSKWKVIGGTCGMWNVFMRQMKNSLFNYVCIFAGNQQLITEPETLQPSYAPNLKGATGVEDIRPVSWSSSSKSIDVIDSCTRTDHNCSNLHHWLEMRCW